MKKWITAILTLVSINAFALTVDEIVDKANQASYYAGSDGQADVKMVITDAGGGTREREFRILRLNTGNGTQKFYVYFKEPADVRRQVFMVWKEVEQGKDDSRWLFLPALNLVKPIAPGDKRTSFVGSDFVYEDVSGRALWEDTHELIDETDTQYIVKNVPKDPGSVDFSKYTVQIDKETFLPVKAEYLDQNGKLYRRVEATKIETIQGFPTVTESRVDDLARGTYTVNSFSSVQYNIGLKDMIFTERFLRRPPREATK
ncbi:outer membrane lipoprotein-sorting protein [Tichowtungia aerotolerans]|uniref:Outer membrane lipoprotein-sorting protein n=1 Tax=Tichowtungia aerotolerans TaxID=2697043 RepID=A0A6P1M6F7_9BACT|nr:outer membrane lipoprotein-sorting protein [Tichowtungia aerotolerans]QHI69447.1 outer membrane lipoprotein-sorting protein [Tichowtungia aerotolerans]